MPQLKPCRQCSHKVATDAQSCPSCGTALPAAGGGLLAFQGLMYMIALGALGWALLSLWG
jgi:hypothetical protein